MDKLGIEVFCSPAQGISNKNPTAPNSLYKTHFKQICDCIHVERGERADLEDFRHSE